MYVCGPLSASDCVMSGAIELTVGPGSSFRRPGLADVNESSDDALCPSTFTRYFWGTCSSTVDNRRKHVEWNNVGYELHCVP